MSVEVLYLLLIRVLEADTPNHVDVLGRLVSLKNELDSVVGLHYENEKLEV